MSTTPCAVPKVTLLAGSECPLTCQVTGSAACVLYPNESSCKSATEKSGACVTQSEPLRQKGSECLLTFQCPTMGVNAQTTSTIDAIWSFYIGDPLVGSGTQIYSSAPVEVIEDLVSKSLKNKGGNIVQSMQFTGNTFAQPKGTFRTVSFPTTFFKNYPVLNRLYLINLDLSEVFSTTESKLPDLGIIYFVNTNLETIPNEITSMTALKFLNFTNNNLKTFPTLQTQNLNELYLGGNLLTDFTNIPSTVTKLDLSRNKLTSIPQAVFDLKLTSLDLTGNGLTNIALNNTQLDALKRIGSGLNADFTVTKCPPGSGISTSSLSSAKGSSSVCVIGLETSAPPTPQPVVDSGISTGAIIGIVAGVVVVLVVGLFLYFRNRRKPSDLTNPFKIDPVTNPYPTFGTGTSPPEIWNDPELLAVKIDASEVNAIQMISRGGFGEVWSGIYQNRPVAIKRLLPDKKTFEHAMEFATEIKVMARLNHPKIVEFIGVSWSNVLNIQAICEYMNCGDLKSLLDRSAKSGTHLPWLNVKLNLAVDISDALVYLHTLNPKFVHRDLKSRNVLIDADNGAKLSDFGISRTRSASETMTAGVGTCRWMAPEVIRGDKYDEACDIWSFGCVLSEMDTGNVPYNDATNTNGARLGDHALADLVLTGAIKPSFLGTIPKEILDVAQKCLEVDPSRRPKATQVSFILRKYRKEVEKNFNSQSQDGSIQ